MSAKELALAALRVGCSSYWASIVKDARNADEHDQIKHGLDAIEELYRRAKEYLKEEPEWRSAIDKLILCGNALLDHAEQEEAEWHKLGDTENEERAREDQESWKEAADRVQELLKEPEGHLQGPIKIARFESGVHVGDIEIEPHKEV